VAPDFTDKCRAGIKLVIKSVLSSYIRPCLYEVMEKLENNLGCKRMIWFDKALCDDFLMVRDKCAHIAGGRVSQNTYFDSPFS